MKKAGFMIVIGASAGGLKAVGKLLASFKPGIDAAICVILHVSKTAGNSSLLGALQRRTPLPCNMAEDDMPLEPGRVYLAPADRHMILKQDRIFLGRGPAEGRWRPSIDVSFRSAAASWDTHCIGIVLTGMLDDGTSGMEAIKRCGGYTIVQDPGEAEYPDMPLSVLQQVQTDRSLPVEDMAAAVIDRIRQDLSRITPPADILLEASLSEQVATNIGNLRELGQRSTYSCPDCGGGLWEMSQGAMTRYRCHIGHAYTERELLDQQGKKIEDTLWIALRMMEERYGLLVKLAENEKDRGKNRLTGNYQDRAMDIRVHIDRLKTFLFDGQDSNANLS